MAHKTTTQQELYRSETLYVAFELSKKSWRVLCSTGGVKKLSATMKPGSSLELKAILDRANKKFGLVEDPRILSCLEAGRDGFWPHRFLVQHGIESLVVDPSSMKVSRHYRRAKTDRIDVNGMLADLVRFDQGDDDVWRVVHVPSAEDEDHRHLHRELEQLKKEKAQHRNRLRSILTTAANQIGSRESARPATHESDPHWLSSPGCGFGISRTAISPSGSKNGMTVSDQGMPLPCRSVEGSHQDRPNPSENQGRLRNDHADSSPRDPGS